jgi:hypothetical protein
MKRTVTIGLLGAILAITVGFISTNAISVTPFFMAGSDISSDESFGMLGHVEYTVLDYNGQIKQYVQGDNQIVDQGRKCAAQLIFNSSDTSSCAFNGDGFNFIGIGNGTFAASNAALQLNDTDNIPNCLGTGDWCEMQRNPGEVTITSANPGTTIAKIKTAMPFTFDHGNVNHVFGVIPITESGLFDTAGVGTGNMFSNRAVSGIEVTSSDTLEVTWTITVTATP